MLPPLLLLLSALFSAGQCKSVPEQRITGGQPLTVPVPFQISYQSKIDGYHVCSGIIIDEERAQRNSRICVTSPQFGSSSTTARADHASGSIIKLSFPEAIAKPNST